MDLPTHSGLIAPSARFSFRSAYSRFSLVLLVITFAALIPNFFTTLITNSQKLSLEWAVHGFLFLGWYILFSLQTALISGKSIQLHKKLGYISIAFFSVLTLSGIGMMLGTMNSYTPDWDPQQLMARTSFVWAIFHTLVFFCGFYVLGILFRKKGELHKRFMLLASLSMMSATLTRFAYLPGFPINGVAFTLLGTYALLITPLVIDRIVYKRIHPTLVVGTLLYAITQIVAIGIIPSTEFGKGLAFDLEG